MEEFTDLVKILLVIAIIFILAKATAFVFNRFGIPGLVGEILIGVLLALSIGDTSIAQMLGIYEIVNGERVGTDVFYIIEIIANIGVMFLLFSVGLETRVTELLKVGKTAFLVALLGVIIPFGLGYAYIAGVYHGDTNQAMFLGAAMVATSVGITARVIKDMRLTDAKESRIIIGAAVIDDVLGMIVLAIVKGMVDAGGSINILEIAKIALFAFGFVIIIMLLAYFAVPKFYEWRNARIAAKIESDPDYKPVKYDMFVIAIGTCLLFSWFAEFIGLAAIIGAFLAGMLFADYAEQWDLHHKTEAITTFLVSFFFVYVGLQVNLNGVGGELLLTALIVLVLAIIGKYIGCGLGAKLGDKTIDKNSFNIIGVGMIPRGEVGIIVATIGLDLLGQENFGDLFTVVVLMSVITTIIAPPILSMLFKKKYGEKPDIPEEACKLND